MHLLCHKSFVSRKKSSSTWNLWPFLVHLNGHPPRHPHFIPRNMRPLQSCDCPMQSFPKSKWSPQHRGNAGARLPRLPRWRNTRGIRWNKGKQKNNRMRNGENKPGDLNRLALVVWLCFCFDYLSFEVRSEGQGRKMVDLETVGLCTRPMGLGA